MTVSSTLPGQPGCRRSPLSRRRGFTLVEAMISLGVLALTSVGGMSAFMLLNRYSANLRNLSMARSLCQERIEQALTEPFRPIPTTASPAVVPMAPSADPTQAGPLPILGPLTSYNAATGVFTGAANTQTTSENIPVFLPSEGTTANSSAMVSYIRTTNVTASALLGGPSGTLGSLNLVQFTVTVSYRYLNQTYTTSMSTMRGPD